MPIVTASKVAAPVDTSVVTFDRISFSGRIRRLTVIPGWLDSNSPLSCSSSFICGLPTIPTVMEPVAPPEPAGAADPPPPDDAPVLGAPPPVDGELPPPQAATTSSRAAAVAASLSQGFVRSGLSFMRLAPLPCSDGAGYPAQGR